MCENTLTGATTETRAFAGISRFACNLDGMRKQNIFPCPHAILLTMMMMSTGIQITAPEWLEKVVAYLFSQPSPGAGTAVAHNAKGIFYPYRVSAAARPMYGSRFDDNIPFLHLYADVFITVAL
ncbi:MAG: hypothetical protein GF398_12095 [Chitinivibrionales bacterium]|nr:hypothetical protein [Chitinivibrionales bacterium]